MAHLIVNDNRRRFSPILSLVIALSATACPAEEATVSQLNREFIQSVRPFLSDWCLECHNSDDAEAMLDLSVYSRATDVTKAHPTWQVILERLEADEMPPRDSKQPSDQERKKVIEWIRSARRLEAARNAGDPGPVLARRLSNAEYNYSIRDLTGQDIRPTLTFPVDPANAAGFDNSGESLAMSPALLKKYLGAARQVVEHLVLHPNGIAFAPYPVVANTDRDRYCVKRIVQFYKRQPTDFADYFFAAWLYQQRKPFDNADASLESIAAANHVSAKYLQTIWTLLQSNDATDKKFVGPIGKLQAMWRTLPSGRNQKKAARAECERMRDFVVGLRKELRYTFESPSVEGVYVGSQSFVLWRNRQRATHRRTFSRNALQVRNEAAKDDDKFNDDLLIPTDATKRRQFEASLKRFCSVFPDAFYISERGRDYVEDSKKNSSEQGRFLSAGFHSMMGYFRDDTPLCELILNDTDKRELDGLWQELDFVTSAPTRQYAGFIWFERTDTSFLRDPQFDFARSEDKASQSSEMIGRLAKVYLAKARANGGVDDGIRAIEHYFRDINLQIRRVERERIAAEPGHRSAVLEFAARAYRRELTLAERNEFEDFYQSLRHDGLNHEQAIQDVIVSVLMSPHFCYRTDPAGAGDNRVALTNDELASRLSFFLWSSIPDSRLLQLAKAGDLNRRDVVIAETRRMLQDERVRGLAVEFGGNWLDFRRFEQHNAVDRKRFPTFNDELRTAMFEEPVRFFVDMAQNDGPVTELLDADHTFVNATLAKHYGIPIAELRLRDSSDTAAETNTQWARVNNVGQKGRGGLLPMSVFLTLNAPGLRTSPVKRGYWVVRRLLGERIPAPPPNVPDLPDDESKLGQLTLREALARHREHKSCAGCHDRFDSIGLAFEGFGPIGERRDKDLGGRPVDTTATFPGGSRGDGVNDLRSYLRNHRQDDFLENLCRKMLSYALGRSLILSDDLLVDEIRTRLKKNDFRFNSLIETIVTSQQFLNKRSD